MKHMNNSILVKAFNFRTIITYHEIIAHFLNFKRHIFVLLSFLRSKNLFAPINYVIPP